MYVDEDGLVHYCAQQRGYPAKPLAEYGAEDLRREFRCGRCFLGYNALEYRGKERDGDSSAPKSGS